MRAPVLKHALDHECDSSLYCAPGHDLGALTLPLALTSRLKLLLVNSGTSSLQSIRHGELCRDPKAAGAQQSTEEAAFDRARRELVFELRGAPADRTRTAEELADLERERLEVRGGQGA